MNSVVLEATEMTESTPISKKRNSPTNVLTRDVNFTKRSHQKLAPLEGKHSLREIKLKNRMGDRNRTPNRLVETIKTKTKRKTKGTLSLAPSHENSTL